MKTLIIFSATVILAVASLGQTNTPAPLYVHFGVDRADGTKRLLSTQIHLGEAIYVGGDDYWKLTGHVERQGTNIVADLVADTGSESQFYRGTVTLEKPFYAQGGGASGGVTPIWFVVSTNADSKLILENVKEMIKKNMEQVR